MSAREAGIPPSSETQAEPTGWEAEPESTHGSERGPSGPARGDAGRSDRRGAERGVDPSTRTESGKVWDAAVLDDSTIATAIQSRMSSVCQRRLRTDAS